MKASLARSLASVLLALTLAVLCTGCDGADPDVATNMTLDGSGYREFVATVSSSDLSTIYGGATRLESVLREACPSVLRMSKAATSSGGMAYRFHMDFASVAELQTKLTKIAGKQVTCRLTASGSPFSPVYEYSESRPAIDYFQWMSKAVKAAGISSYDESTYFATGSGSNVFSIPGLASSSARWSVTSAPHFSWKAPVTIAGLKVRTEFDRDWGANRVVQITVSEDEAKRMDGVGAGPLDYLQKAAPEGANVNRSTAGGQVTFEVSFKAKDPADLQAQSQKLFGSDTLSVAQVTQGVPALKERRTYSETVDLVAWLGVGAVGEGVGSFEVSFPGRLVAEGQATGNKSIAQPFTSSVSVEATVEQTNTTGVAIAIGLIALAAGGLAFLLISQRKRLGGLVKQGKAALAEVGSGLAQTAGARASQAEAARAARTAGAGPSVAAAAQPTEAVGPRLPAGTCPACGHKNSPRDKFCRACGVGLPGPAGAQTGARPNATPQVAGVAAVAAPQVAAVKAAPGPQAAGATTAPARPVTGGSIAAAAAAAPAVRAAAPMPAAGAEAKGTPRPAVTAATPRPDVVGAAPTVVADGTATAATGGTTTAATEAAPASARRFISPAVFGLVIILFLLPFFSISCQGQEIFEVTGMNLVFGTSYQGEALDPEPLAIFALLTVAVGLVIGLAKVPRKHLASAAAAVLAAVLEIALGASIGHAASDSGLEAKGAAGFYLSLLFLLAAGAYNVYEHTLENPRPVRPGITAGPGGAAGRSAVAGPGGGGSAS